MSTIVSSLQKDTKLIIRNWHTILSFMILPFVLILVIGFIFGTDSDATITVGFEGVDPAIFPDVDEIRSVEVASCRDEFSGLNACIADMDGRIEIFVDNSRTNLYAYTISLLQQAIERENEQAAITSISAFKSDLERQLASLQGASVQIANVDSSIADANASIEELERAIDETGTSLGQERITLQETRAELESLNAEFEARAARIESQLTDFENDLEELDDSLADARANVALDYVPEIDEMRQEISESLVLIEELKATIDNVDRSQDVVLAQVVSSSARLDELLDSFTIYSERISSQRELVTALSATASDLEFQLGSVENGTREALGFTPSEILRSVNAKYTLFYDVDIRLIILPMVIMMILVFLSTVIGSLLTHEELTSSAMVRVELSASSRSIMDFSKTIVITGIVLINVLLMYVIALTLWNADFIARLPVLIGISIPAIITFALIGSGLAYLIRRPFVLFVAATFVSMMFIIGSGILRPPELLDQLRGSVVAANPATIFLEATRLTLLGGSGPIASLFIWLAASVLFLVISRRMWHRTVFRD